MANTFLTLSKGFIYCKKAKCQFLKDMVQQRASLPFGWRVYYIFAQVCNKQKSLSIFHGQMTGFCHGFALYSQKYCPAFCRMHKNHLFAEFVPWRIKDKVICVPGLHHFQACGLQNFNQGNKPNHLEDHCKRVPWVKSLQLWRKVVWFLGLCVTSIASRW